MDYTIEGGTLYIKEGVTKIPKDAFKANTNIKHIVFPESLEEVGEYAFYDCTNLQSLYFPTKVKHIRGFAFAYCKKLTHIFIPDTLRGIRFSSFVACNNVETVSIKKVSKHINMPLHYINAFTSFSENVKFFVQFGLKFAPRETPKNVIYSQLL